jgi:hypothetical protein
MRTTRNSKTLSSFVEYCESQPDLRFWQALKDWSGYYAIMAIEVNGAEHRTTHGTFYIEERRHDEQSEPSS